MLVDTHTPTYSRTLTNNTHPPTYTHTHKYTHTHTHTSILTYTHTHTTCRSLKLTTTFSASHVASAACVNLFISLLSRNSSLFLFNFFICNLPDSWCMQL